MDDREREPTRAPAGPPAAEGRTLAAIVDELAQLSSERRGEVGVMRDAVIELSHAVARLLEMVREDRVEQRERVAALEAEIATLRGHLEQAREAGFRPHEEEPLSGSDFDRLRIAAEELRASTERLVRDSAASRAAGPSPDEASPAREAEAEQAPPAAVLRVFPGTGAIEGPSLAEQEAAEQAVAAAAEPVDETRPGGADGDDGDDAATNEHVPEPPAAVALARQVVTISPRPGRRRGLALRRRRIDARRLTGIEPAAALRTLLGGVDPRWTAGRKVHLTLALTDGETLEITGGDGEALTLREIAGDGAKTPDSVIVASSGQLVPLFGRLALTGAEPAPELRGPRRDADLVVGWIDRAQRLEPAPL